MLLFISRQIATTLIFTSVGDEDKRMLNCKVCGVPLTELESEFNGVPVHNNCLEVAIIASSVESMKYIPLDTPEWLKEFGRKFKGWSHYHYGV
jgi:hypothetical protein